MRVGWHTQRLGDLCEIVKGRKPKLKAQASDGDLPYLVAKVMRGSQVPEFASLADRNSIPVAEDETIIICDGSNSGEVFTGFRGILSSTMGKLVKKGPIDYAYLRAFLDSTFEVFNGAKTGAAIPHLDKEALYELPFSYPPLKEQRRIVAILDEAFEGIATAKSNAEKNLQNARELFESKLFALLGEDGADWTRKTLREVSVDFGRGKSKHRPRNDPRLYGGPYPFIQTGDVRGSEHLIAEYTQTYSEAGLAQSKLWPRGTLCITIAANIAETGVLDFEACFPDSVIGVVVDESQTSAKYLEYMLHTVKADLKAKGKGSAQDNINLATFENERFAFPDLGTQARIVSLLDDLSSEVQRLECLYTLKLTALDELRKSLLHQAFTSAMAVKTTDREVAEVA